MFGFILLFLFSNKTLAHRNLLFFLQICFSEEAQQEAIEELLEALCEAGIQTKVDELTTALGLTPDVSSCLSNSSSVCLAVNELYDYKNSANFDVAFAQQAAEAICNNGEVNFEEKIINNLTGKAKCIYDKLEEQNVVRKMLNRFGETNSPATLKFQMSSLGNNFADTSLPNANDLITISLNSDSGFWGVDFQPNLLVAQTLFHEIIHAEFFRQLVEAIGAGVYGNSTTDLEIITALSNPSPDLYVIYNYFRDYKNWSHAYMENYYRETIASFLQEYDTGVFPEDSSQIQEQYLLLAWKGLRYNNIQSWNTLSTVQKNNINDTINNYTSNNENQTCN